MKRSGCFVFAFLFLLTACAIPNRPVPSVQPSVSSVLTDQSSTASDAPKQVQKPDKPYGFDLLPYLWQQELYQMLEEKEITPDRPYLFDLPLEWDQIYPVIELYSANHQTLLWREYGYFPLFEENGEKVLGIRAEKQFDNRGNDQVMCRLFDQTAEHIMSELPPKEAADEVKIKAIAEYITAHVSYFPKQTPIGQEILTV